MYQPECATLKGRLEGKTEEIESLQAHVKTVEVQVIGYGVSEGMKGKQIGEKEDEGGRWRRRWGRRWLKEVIWRG